MSERMHVDDLAEIKSGKLPEYDIHKEELDRIEALLKDYEPGDESLLIPLLQDAQKVNGYLSDKIMNRVAKHLKVPVSRAYSVSTFYTQFHHTPCGENIIKVCTGTGCHVRGGKHILDVLESSLGIKAGETTKDLMFSLETVACLGTCFLSPVMVINGEYFGKLTPKRTLEILDQFKQRKLGETYEKVKNA